MMNLPYDANSDIDVQGDRPSNFPLRLTLQRIRDQAGLTQPQFCVAVGWDSVNALSYVSAIESGERPITQRTLTAYGLVARL